MSTQEGPTLQGYLDAHPEASFVPGRPVYFKDGDYLSVFCSDDICRSERIDDFLTVYVSEESREMVGIKLKGVSRLAQHVRHIVGVNDGKVALGLILLPAAAQSNTAQSVKKYYEVGEKVRDVEVDCSVFA